MAASLIELGGRDGEPILHLSPANGFPPQVYAPLLRGMTGYRALCLPPRALWEGEAPPKDRRGWRQAADDLLDGLARHELRDVVAVGHSFGGVVSMMALLDAPERFQALIMLDPVFLPPAILALQTQAWEEGFIDQHPMVQRVRRRRRAFDSREAAFQRFRDKPTFADWSDESLWLYIEHGLRARADGSLELRWNTDWEEYYFATIYERVWEDLARLDGLRPALVVRASDSFTLPPESVALLRSIAPNVHYVNLQGQGHLFPMAAPELTANLLREWLQDL